MPVGSRLDYTIRAIDETGGALRSFREAWSGGFQSITAAGLAAAAAILAGLEDVSNRSQEIIRNLRVRTGVLSPGQEEALAAAQLAGIGEDPATEAIAAIAGPGRRLGLDVGDRPLVAGLAGISAAGGDPGAALRGAGAFGVSGPDVLPQLQLAYGSAAEQGLDPSTLSEILRQYSPVFAALGLNFIEAVQFAADLHNAGVPVSRVSPALNRFIRDASRAGVSGLEAISVAFEEIRQADPAEAAALGQEIFGAEGGLRLTQAIRSGDVGLGEELLPGNLGNVLALQSLAAGTDRQSIDRFLSGQQLGGNVVEQSAAGLLGLGFDIPVVGPLARGGAGAASRALGAGTPTDALIVQQPGVIELLQAIYDETRARNQAGGNQGYEAWLESQAANN